MQQVTKLVISLVKKKIIIKKFFKVKFLEQWYYHQFAITFYWRVEFVLYWKSCGS